MWTVDNISMSSLFDAAPGTSAQVAQHTADAGDEVHVVVYDEDGGISGTPGTILETYAYLSLATDAKTDDGSTNNVAEVLNNNSRYVWIAMFSIRVYGYQYRSNVYWFWRFIS